MMEAVEVVHRVTEMHRDLKHRELKLLGLQEVTRKLLDQSDDDRIESDSEGSN